MSSVSSPSAMGIFVLNDFFVLRFERVPKIVASMPGERVLMVVIRAVEP